MKSLRKREGINPSQMSAIVCSLMNREFGEEGRNGGGGGGGQGDLKRKNTTQSLMKHAERSVNAALLEA